jgi:predicted nucleic acid-binding protein
VRRHLLDTSALLAHCFDEPGADIVARLWRTGRAKPSVAAVTVTELRGRLREELDSEAEASRVADCYLNELTVCLPVDRATAELAWQLKLTTPGRLPLVDALIAACARRAGAVLVHRDPHMARIPVSLVEQEVLPDG